ncbi:MAG TPA: hypothetical protein VFK23_01750 [Nitrospirota bacterium]|nr:hypothetical protein [Nitrospirota bacterium]
MQHSRTRTFEKIDKTRIDAILKGLIDNGSRVTGTNPWDVETRSHGVRLRGEWNEEASMLTIAIVDADWYVPRKKIWENIESLMRIVEQR